MLTLPRDAFRDASAYQGQQQQEGVRGSHERTGPAQTVFCHTYFPCSLALRFYQVASVFCSGSESGVRGWYRGGWASFESSDRFLRSCGLLCNQAWSFLSVGLRYCAIASGLSLVPVLRSRPERFHRKFRKPFIEEVGGESLVVREGCQ
ncbi:unnamed protein product [Sphagnum troendelagicum]|uniref:Uncharacterized protein n=1 Tax=Sphagnum troendelagicum TaxID=128251 RepID=A0ABP0U0H3_9BRYO